MGITLPFKQLLSIGCCLFVVSGLAAQPVVPQPRRFANDQAPPAGYVRPPVITEEQLQQTVINQMAFEKLQLIPGVQPKRVAPPEWMHWRWLVYGLVALGGLGGSWGAKQVLMKNPRLLADSSKPRVHRMGLGTDGSGGVWLREVPAWEK
jgi:hypothetical protein